MNVIGDSSCGYGRGADDEEVCSDNYDGSSVSNFGNVVDSMVSVVM